MIYNQLGNSDLQVSRLCFGCWQLSPKFWGDVPLDPWYKALTTALDLGINFIDTADAYGDGYAEESLGSFFKKEKMRDKFILATKFYWNFKKERHPDTRYAYILQACEDSLKRLQTDHIDLYQIHAFDPLTRPDEVGAALHRLRKEGKIRWFGVSNLNVEQMNMYQKYFDITSLQPHYNLLHRDIEQHELPYCITNTIGVIPYSPLFRGLLTGKYSRQEVFTDSRKNLPLFNGTAFQTIMDALDELKSMAQNFELTLPQLAIRWLLTHPAITSAIIGIKTPDHITTMLPAADKPLPIDAWHKIAGIMTQAKTKAEKQ